MFNVSLEHAFNTDPYQYGSTAQNADQSRDPVLLVGRSSLVITCQYLLVSRCFLFIGCYFYLIVSVFHKNF